MNALRPLDSSSISPPLSAPELADPAGAGTLAETALAPAGAPSLFSQDLFDPGSQAALAKPIFSEQPAQSWGPRALLGVVQALTTALSALVSLASRVLGLGQQPGNSAQPPIGRNSEPTSPPEPSRGDHDRTPGHRRSGDSDRGHRARGHQTDGHRTDGHREQRSQHTGRSRHGDRAGGSSRVEERRHLSPKLRLVRELALLAKKHGVPAELPIITALTESGLRNLRGGDRDSVGLFQQRAAWGSFAERHDPIKSARLFLFGGHGGQRGALDFKSRFAHLGPSAYGAWAQAVQVSAFPGRYQTHLAEARRLLQQAGVKPGLN